jgi:hypothetical protein
LTSEETVSIASRLEHYGTSAAEFENGDGEAAAAVPTPTPAEQHE